MAGLVIPQTSYPPCFSPTLPSHNASTLQSPLLVFARNCSSRSTLSVRSRPLSPTLLPSRRLLLWIRLCALKDYRYFPSGGRWSPSGSTYPRALLPWLLQRRIAGRRLQRRLHPRVLLHPVGGRFHRRPPHRLHQALLFRTRTTCSTSRNPRRRRFNRRW